MSQRLSISSPQNERLKQVLSLQNRRTRTETGLILVEGFAELGLALANHARLQSLFLCPALLKAGEEALVLQLEASLPLIHEISADLMKKLCYREHPDAWLAVIHKTFLSLDQLQASLVDRQVTHPLLVVTEQLEKPGNLGAILRSADAVGADGVLVCDGRTDPGNPNVVRASKGSIFSQAVVECSNQDALDWLQKNEIQIFAASPSGTKSIWQSDLSASCALVLGTEKEGLSSFWLQAAREQVQIPMRGSVNSLNVAQAATLLLYESWRQRQIKGTT